MCEFCHQCFLKIPSSQWLSWRIDLISNVWIFHKNGRSRHYFEKIFLFTNEIIKHYGENFKIVTFNNLQLKINAEGEGNKNGVKIY